ncbi:MAG: hypothetical protein J4445_00655 [DPANN group archaeon]|nr:hypothetical protein [DPANN group archaeon]
MRLIIPLFILLILPAAYADDLELSITAGNFFSDESNKYKLIVRNLDGTAPEYINFTIEYWISNSNDELISGYPKTTNNDLKEQRTINRQWTPDDTGLFSICAKIISTTTNDDNSDNDYFCSEVSVAGQVNQTEEIVVAEESSEEETNSAVMDGIETYEEEVNISFSTSTEENKIELIQLQNVPSNKIEKVFEQKPDTTKAAMFLFIVALVTIIIVFLFKTYKDSNKL